MNFALAVLGSPHGSGAARSALAFARAALAEGHSLQRVFFYHDAVYTGSRQRVAPQDELDLTRAWAQLARHHQVELLVCVAASLRRGIIDADEAERHERSGATLDDAFEIAGLGQLVDAALSADRLVTFGY